jgi:hypothetical protein
MDHGWVVGVVIACCPAEGRRCKNLGALAQNAPLLLQLSRGRSRAAHRPLAASSQSFNILAPGPLFKRRKFVIARFPQQQDRQVSARGGRCVSHPQEQRRRRSRDLACTAPPLCAWLTLAVQAHRLLLSAAIASSTQKPPQFNEGEWQASLERPEGRRKER